MQGIQAGRRVTKGLEGGFRPSTVAVLFVVLIAVASIPIATHPLPPLADYPNHLARMHVIDTIGSDSDLARFYTVEWQLIPNLMIDLIVPILHRFMNVYLAGQIYIIVTFIMTASGTLALNRALIGRWSALPLIAMPLLYNGVLLVGVMNYVFGIGLALWALAAWVALRERHWALRLAVSSLFAVALFFCHLFAVGLYGLGLLALELNRLWARRGQPLWPRIADFFATGLPFVPLIPLLMLSPTWHVAGTSAYWEFGGKLEGLLLAVNVYYQAVAFVVIAIAAIAAAYARHRGVLRFHPVGWAFLGVSVVAYLAMPFALFGAYLADQRLPIAATFMIIACFDVELPRLAARRGLVALIALLLAARIAEVQLVWNHLDRYTNEFVQSVKTIKRGARVLVVYGDRSSGKEISDFNLVHAASLATIERSALVTNAFTAIGKQILHVRKEYIKFVETEDRWPPSVSYFVQVADRANTGEPYFWDLWPRHYDYVYILFTTPRTPNPDRKHLDIVYSGTEFQLYRVML